MTLGGSTRLAVDRFYLYFGIIDPCLGPTDSTHFVRPAACLRRIVHIILWTFFFSWLDPRRKLSFLTFVEFVFLLGYKSKV